MSARLGQYQLTLVPAASDGVRQTLVHVRASATGAFVFAGAPSVFVRVVLEVRTLLPALVHLVSAFKVVSASSGALPALVGHVLVLTHAVLDELRKGRFIGDDGASHRSVDELVAFVRLLLVPLVHHAGDGTSYVHGLTGDRHAIAKDKERCRHGQEQLHEVHSVLLRCKTFCRRSNLDLIETSREVQRSALVISGLSSQHISTVRFGPLFGHPTYSDQCPLLGVKRTCADVRSNVR